MDSIRGLNNIVLARWFQFIGRLYTTITAKGISSLNEPHPVPGMVLSKAKRTKRAAGMPYLSIFGTR
jgi:hypothetical protein